MGTALFSLGTKPWSMARIPHAGFFFFRQRDVFSPHHAGDLLVVGPFTGVPRWNDVGDQRRIKLCPENVFPYTATLLG